MPSTAGATKSRKSEGVIHAGTANTPSIIPSESLSSVSESDISSTLASSSSGVGLPEPSRKTCTVPSGRLVDPIFFRVCGTKVASAGPNKSLFCQYVRFLEVVDHVRTSTLVLCRMYNSAHMIQINPVDAYRTVSVVFLSWRQSRKGVSSERRLRRVVWKWLEERYWNKRSRSLGRRRGGRVCVFWIQDDAYVISMLHGIGRADEKRPGAESTMSYSVWLCWRRGTMTRPILRGLFSFASTLQMSFSHRASQTLSSAALISLTKPFTPSTLNILRNALQRIPDLSDSPFNQSGASKQRHAAVLIPFCNVGGEPGILLEVRAKTLRSHSGEIRWASTRQITRGTRPHAQPVSCLHDACISFPGGRIDDVRLSLRDFGRSILCCITDRRIVYPWRAARNSRGIGCRPKLRGDFR